MIHRLRTGEVDGRSPPQDRQRTAKSPPVIVSILRFSKQDVRDENVGSFQTGTVCMRRRGPFGRVFRCIPVWASYSLHPSARKMRSFFLSAEIVRLLGQPLRNYHFIQQRLTVQGLSVLKTGAPCRMVCCACGRAPKTSGKACRQLKGAPGARD